MAKQNVSAIKRGHYYQSFQVPSRLSQDGDKGIDHHTCLDEESEKHELVIIYVILFSITF